MTYPQIYENDWVQPISRNYRAKCCKCGLIHLVDFKIKKVGKKNYILFRARLKK